MSVGPLVSFEPSELIFPFELNKQLASSIRLLNKTDGYVAFKLLTTNPKNYGVRPRIGILQPGAARDITVTTRAVREASHKRRCKDKFMIQSAVASADTTMEDVPRMFNKEAGDIFQEFKLQVVYMKPTESSFGASVVESPKSEAAEVFSPSLGMYMIESPRSNVPQTSNPVLQPQENVLQTSTRKLLDAQPPKLQFPSILNEEFSCSLRLSNVTENHVAFRVKTASPKYIVQPSSGILLPQSTCDVTVRMQVKSKVPSAMQSGDKVLIQSVVATTSATTEEIIPDMFDKARSPIDECELEVVYISKQESNCYRIDELILSSIAIILVALVFFYLTKQTLSWIWSLTMLGIMLMMKMIKKLVSDSVEDWVVKTLLSIFTHFMHYLFSRKGSIRLSSD